MSEKVPDVLIVSSIDSPFNSDEIELERISLTFIPKIWQALWNERKVLVEGCMKYSIALL